MYTCTELHNQANTSPACPDFAYDHHAVASSARAMCQPTLNVLVVGALPAWAGLVANVSHALVRVRCRRARVLRDASAGLQELHDGDKEGKNGDDGLSDRCKGRDGIACGRRSRVGLRCCQDLARV